MATMSRNVFKNILRSLRTDDYQIILQQKSTHKLEATTEVWEIFTANCQKYLVRQP